MYDRCQQLWKNTHLVMWSVMLNTSNITKYVMGVLHWKQQESCDKVNNKTEHLEMTLDGESGLKLPNNPVMAETLRMLSTITIEMLYGHAYSIHSGRLGPVV